VDLNAAETFFLDKIRNQAQEDGVAFPDFEERCLLLSRATMSHPAEEITLFIQQGGLKALNNKVMLLLSHAMQHDLTSTSEVKKLRLGWLKSFTMPGDWHDAYMSIFNKSDKFISAVLQNFILGTPIK
jgi:hypothetical protein